MINRDIEKLIADYMRPGKAMLIYGSRRVGKTVLLRQMIANTAARVSVLNGESMDTMAMFANRTIANYRQLFSGTDILVVDEAQNIPSIGQCLKLIVDEIDGISVLASGSSSFDLQNKTGEPLVGRASVFQLLPLSINELRQQWTNLEIVNHLDDLLIYGMYPEIFSIGDYQKKQRYLTDLTQSYLMKDILAIDGVKSSAKMYNLLRLVAYQVGSIVSYDELAKQLGLSRNTVEKYLDLLTKVFILYKIPAYSTNPRKELTKASKWYFFDNGIRNALIDNYSPLSLRDDNGHLWENFMIGERIKLLNNAGRKFNHYFWRSFTKQEVDLVEETDGRLQAYEFKWSNDKAKEPSVFKSLYPDTDFKTVSKNNFLEWV